MAAGEAPPGADVAVISKMYPTRSHELIDYLEPGRMPELSERLAVDPLDTLGPDRMKILGVGADGLEVFRELLFSVRPKGIKLPPIALE